MRRPAWTLSLAAALLLVAGGAAAQRPAELVGRVVDGTGAPVEGADLELVDSGEGTTTGAAGRYRFRAVSGGRHTLRVVRIGYLTRTVTVELEPGLIRSLDITLQAAPVALEGLTVRGRREPVGGVRLERDEIEAAGALSAGDIIRTVPGVVVASTFPGGPETVSIRGSGSDAVLVLVDGVVLNDPITGEADLSELSASAIESVTVLSGARSARYGPRAEAGVILIETRRATAGRFLRTAVGSLDARSVAAGWGADGPLRWSAGGAWRALAGEYDFTLPPDVGGGERRRRNADAERWNGWVAGSGDVIGGVLRVDGAAGFTRRGLPGKAYLPSLHARQETRRFQGSASWRRAGPGSALQLVVDGARHDVWFRDPDPPAGLPYDDTAAVESWGLRAEAERPRTGDGVGFGAGTELRWQRVRTDRLTAAAGSTRLYAGLFVHGEAGLTVADGSAALSAQLRTDREPTSGWILSRSVTLSYTRDAWTAHVANRSSYSPPALSDQYFRDAVGVEPNPDLEPERVPSEWEAGLRAEGTLAGLRVSIGTTAYRGDVRGMIIWAPDYRFVWSPRNVDVRRSGLETRTGVQALRGRLRIDASHTYARTTYDRAGTADTVQVIYRPRHTATVRAEWRAGTWHTHVESRYTGVRNPVPAPVNALPGFWTLSGGLAADLALGGWTVTPGLRVDRLLDQRASLIFGFPEPGRTWRLELTLRRNRGLNP